MEVTEPNEFAFYWKGQIEGDEGCDFRSTVVYNQWLKVREAVREAKRKSRYQQCEQYTSSGRTAFRNKPANRPSPLPGCEKPRHDEDPTTLRTAGLGRHAGRLVGPSRLRRPELAGTASTPPPPARLGTISDQYWTQQETNGEAWKSIIFQHEFKRNGVRLNWAGEDHVKQIAADAAQLTFQS